MLLLSSYTRSSSIWPQLSAGIHHAQWQTASWQKHGSVAVPGESTKNPAKLILAKTSEKQTKVVEYNPPLTHPVFSCYQKVNRYTVGSRLYSKACSQSITHTSSPQWVHWQRQTQSVFFWEEHCIHNIYGLVSIICLMTCDSPPIMIFHMGYWN